MISHNFQIKRYKVQFARRSAKAFEEIARAHFLYTNSSENASQIQDTSVSSSSTAFSSLYCHKKPLPSRKHSRIRKFSPNVRDLTEAFHFHRTDTAHPRNFRDDRISTSKSLPSYTRDEECRCFQCDPERRRLLCAKVI